jgi:GT2 family glycosyltransferase
MTRPRVGVVVLSWNASNQAAAAARSALAQDYPELFVIVVDNDSAVEEMESLQAEFVGEPRVEFLPLRRNLGYAGGNNAGATLAFDRDAQFVLILTQDARLEPGALFTLVETASRYDAGLVGPRILDWRNQSVELSCGERLSVPLLCAPRRLMRYRYTNAEPHHVSGLMGCVLLISRGCWEQLAGFDERYFAYYEEVDFCLRAARYGWGIWCAPSAVALHDGMRGFAAGFTPLSAELKARNLLWTMRRHARPADWILLLPMWLGLMAGSLVLYALQRRADIVAAILRGAARGLSTETPAAWQR